GRVLQIGELSVPIGADAMLRLSGTARVRIIPALQLLNNAETRADLVGCIVLIGSTAPELGGLRVTPASPATPDVQIQAQAVDAILRGDTPIRPAWADLGELAGAVGLGLLCLLLAISLRP